GGRYGKHPKPVTAPPRSPKMHNYNASHTMKSGVCKETKVACSYCIPVTTQPSTWDTSVFASSISNFSVAAIRTSWQPKEERVYPGLCFQRNLSPQGRTRRYDSRNLKLRARGFN
ncbi:mCG1044075, partial [Mus musculus]